MKEIDLNLTLYELTEAYPELIDILSDLGFAGVALPEMRETHGKVMTIPKGCEMHGKDLSEVVSVLREHGFEVKS
jgi:Domain of unknown function (DUF1858)